MIDLDKLSIETLLALTRKLRLIEHYEFDQQQVLMIISRQRYHVSRGRARTFLKDMLTEWRQRQRDRSPLLRLPEEEKQPARVL